MKLLEKQGWHLAALIILMLLVAAVGTHNSFRQGMLLGVSTPGWLALTVLNAVLHQVWVLVFWRLELHSQAVSRRFGSLGFAFYGFGFAVLFLLRPVLLVFLAQANAATLPLPPNLSWVLAGILTVPAMYVMYSVARYFGFRRALGADHFDTSYRELGLERRGSFGLIRNSMYVLGLLFLWLPGLIWRSNAALLAAAFQHSYIWVHYYTVELPDMRRIYGETEAG